MINNDQDALRAKVAEGVKRRRRFETVFRRFGLFSVCLGLFFLCAMLIQIISSGVGAFQQTYIAI